jgi:hypothetical protein
MNTDKLRVQLAFALVIVGILLTLILIGLLVFVKKWTATDTVAVVGAFTSVLGTIIGAFIGLQVGAADKDKERQERRQTEAALKSVLLELDPTRSDAVRDRLSRLGISVTP